MWRYCTQYTGWSVAALDTHVTNEALICVKLAYSHLNFWYTTQNSLDLQNFVHLCTKLRHNVPKNSKLRQTCMFYNFIFIILKLGESCFVMENRGFVSNSIVEVTSCSVWTVTTNSIFAICIKNRDNLLTFDRCLLAFNAGCFYLRLLLVNVRGPRSFQELRTVNGKVCASYREECQALQLLENDTQWDATLADAVVSFSAFQIRTLFAIILATCFPSNPIQLWENYQDDMAEEILNHVRRTNL